MPCRRSWRNASGAPSSKRAKSAVADIYTKEKRSWLMARVRSTGNRSTESALIALMKSANISGWRRNYPLCGKPDIVFPKARLAVFVDGCFWHGCPLHGQIPKTNKAFWRNKISSNIRRDKSVARYLRNLSWHVFRFGEHDLRRAIVNRKLGRIRAILAQS